MNHRLLLVGWDATDWKFLTEFMDAGELPAIQGIVDHGVAGELQSCLPSDLAAQWTTLLTGKRAWEHQIALSVELDPATRQLQPVRSQKRQGAAIWDILGHRGIKSIALGWPATHGLTPPGAIVVSERYAVPTAPPGVTPWPPAPVGTYWPDSIRQRLDSLRLSPEGVKADIISRYVPLWKHIDQKRDQRLGRLRVSLAAWLSHCAGITELLAKADWNFAAVRLPSVHEIAQLFGRFRSQQPVRTDAKETEVYQNVLRVAIQSLDHTVAIFQKTCGPGTTIMLVSPRGFGEQHQPVSLAATKMSQNGIFIVAGHNIGKDKLLHGASILDIVPTILHWFRLPVGADMAGRVLADVFEEVGNITTLTNWEITIGEQQANADFQAGIPLPSTESVELETRWNLAQSCLEAGQWDAGVAQLKPLVQVFPERPEYCQALFNCYLNLGKHAEAEELLEVVLEGFPSGPLALLPQAELAMAKHDWKRARSLAFELLSLKPQDPFQQHRLGILFLRLREWSALESLARLALEQQQDNPIAWLGLAEALLRKKKPEEAAQAASRAVQLNFSLAEGHLVLARAQLAQSQWQAASESLRKLRQLQPDNTVAATYDRRMIRRE